MSRTVRLAFALVMFTVLVLAIGASGSTQAGDDETLVIVSRPGVVFHKTGSIDVRGRGHERPMTEALASGYVPCKKCFGRPVSEAVNGAGAAGASTTSSSSVAGLGPGIVGGSEWSGLFSKPRSGKFCSCSSGVGASAGESGSGPLGMISRGSGTTTVMSGCQQQAGFPGLQ